MLSLIDYKLLQLMAGRHFHSGRHLGELVGLSRAAIWLRIKHIRQHGITVDAVRGRGYRLATSLDLLDLQTILTEITVSELLMPDCISIFPSIDSTNNCVRDRMKSACGICVCLAEGQSSGRGRSGKQWVSPFASNLYLSIGWRFDKGTARLAGLSLAVSVILVKLLRQLGVERAAIKWPNDILVDNHKLAGVLIEAGGEMHGQCNVIIGVGINVRMDQLSGEMIDQNWTDLQSCHVQIGRSQLAGKVINALIEMINVFIDKGFEAFHSEWSEMDATRGRRVLVSEHDRVIEGIARGIDRQGLLLVEHDGQLTSHASGEVSLRLSP